MRDSVLQKNHLFVMTDDNNVPKIAEDDELFHSVAVSESQLPLRDRSRVSYLNIKEMNSYEPVMVSSFIGSDINRNSNLVDYNDQN